LIIYEEILNMVTQEEFETLLPLATRWVEEQESVVLKEGTPLNPAQLVDAKVVGILYPETVRLMNVVEIPMPSDPTLVTLAEQTGVITPTTAGMCLRYGIYLTLDVWENRQLLIHELVHTSQYERLGGITPFLRQYLSECLNLGYAESPIEQEAVRVSKRVVG